MKAQFRDKSNGQYTESTWDRMCVCGHALGKHTAEKSAGQRPCIIGDFQDEGCDCLCFKASRAKRVTVGP